MDAQREKKRARDFLMGLDTRFDNARSQIIGITPLPNLDLIYNRLLQEEGLRSLTRPTTESNPDVMAFASRAYNSNRQSGGGNNYQGSRNTNSDHSNGEGRGSVKSHSNSATTNFNPNNNQTEHPRPYCLAFKRNGHKFQVCYRVTGNFPEWWGDRPRDRIYVNPNDTDLSRAVFVPDVQGRAAYEQIRQSNNGTGAAPPKAHMASGQANQVPFASSSSSLPAMDNINFNSLNATDLATITRLWQEHKSAPPPSHGPFLEDGDWGG